MKTDTTPTMLTGMRDLSDLVPATDSPNLSIYVPTSRIWSEADDNRLRFKNLVSEAERQVSSGYDRTREIGEMFEALRDLENEQTVWREARDGLVVFANVSGMHTFQTLEPVEEVVVADSYHVTPLVRLLQDPERFLLLCVKADEVKLYHGNRHRLEELDLADEVPTSMAEELGPPDHASKTKRTRYQPDDSDQKDSQLRRWFERLEAKLWEHQIRQIDAPVMLAALPEYHPLFREAADNLPLLEGGVERDPFKDISDDELHELAWRAVHPKLEQRTAELVQRWHNAAGHGCGSDDPAEIAMQAVAGRIHTLLIEQGRHLGGRVDLATGELELKQMDDPKTDDVLDDLAELTLKHNGTVRVVPAEQMPTKQGVAAIHHDGGNV